MKQIKQMIEEVILTEVRHSRLASEEGDKRIAALREMDATSQNIQQFKETMTIAHFDDYFTDCLNRMFYADYEYQAGSWGEYTYPESLTDFRTAKRFRMTEFPTLHRRYEKGEAKAGDVQIPEPTQFGIEEYSEQFDISWQTLLNDDLGALREVPKKMVAAATRFEDGFVSNLFDNAVVQATLAGLGAPWSGTGRLTPQNLAIAINAMKVRTDVRGNLLNIRSFRLLIPPILEMTVQTILGSTLMAGVATNDKNVLPNFIQGYSMDPYIATAIPNVPWYLIASPKSFPTITVARLSSAPKPFVYKVKSNIDMIYGTAPAVFLLGDAETGNITYTVETIIGGADDPALGGVTDFRGLYYSSGTTP